MAGGPPTAAELVAALADHFGRPIGSDPSLERDIAIWICRHWTNEPVREIADVVGCGKSSAAEAANRIASTMRTDRVVKVRVREAEHYLATEAFPLEDEDPERELAITGWAIAQLEDSGELEPEAAEWAGATTARQTAIYLACELTEHSLPEIGQDIGGRNYTTVALGASRMATAYDELGAVRSRVDATRQRLAVSHA